MVRIIGNRSGHCFQIGDWCDVLEQGEDSSLIRFHAGAQWVLNCDFEKIKTGREVLMDAIGKHGFTSLEEFCLEIDKSRINEA